MTKTVKLTSKKQFIHNTPRDIVFGTYAYCPASSAITVFTKAADMFNSGKEQKLIIKTAVKYTNAEEAKIKISGKRISIETFINRLIAETDLLKNFDIRL